MRVDKEPAEVAYAPFRSSAGSAPESASPSKADAESDEREAEQLIKRITTTLERINKALSPKVLENLSDLPNSLRERFQAAVEELHEKISQEVS
jgi:predicted trehalose synthase